MTKNFITQQHDSSTENLRCEDEALLGALKSCDDNTYYAVTSILREAGLLHE